MLYKTRGIALNYVKYRDTSIIARIYTERFGKQSYIVNNIRSARSKKSIGYFQPLTLLDLIVYHDNKKEIHRLSEFKFSEPFSSIPYDIRKGAIALFITEVLNKVTTGEEDNESQFEFLYNAITLLDQKKEHFEDFHNYLLLHLSYYLGFGISSMDDLTHDGDVSLQKYIEDVRNNFVSGEILSNGKTRSKALEILIHYYSTHIDGFGKIKSLAVMQQIFN